MDPTEPDSARGGILAQATQPGTANTQPGSPPNRGATTGTTTGQAGAAGGGAASGQRAAGLSEEAIRASLQARGYSDIQGLQREGDHFRVREAKRYGEDVSDLRIDASSGMLLNEKQLSEAQARNLLRDRGYTDISELSRDGDTITAKAKQGDRQVNVRINADSATVTQLQASN
ncbi:hypothetical protein [Falsiroseomonas sp.]|uniref:hypothetical protein n=1 Tax=Falsiroseomonas sp. TaxID=2870721 RepID=UPI0035673ACB